ncbi:trypsin-like peptidase domain-containing protein [Roseiconus lacunae]|uniref:trypsin-like peptidase domain-containing protein n=1 Tax=Roseiconus lacunae TaxID=2605694 RepID=UPI001E400F98|nr:trypsin-like peptidase domain-containing protein [Roseiconus lacunae]MCD0461293.1 serine protease [Roseiconus lacunae]
MAKKKASRSNTSARRSNSRRSSKKKTVKAEQFKSFPDELASAKVRLLPVSRDVACAKARMVIAQEIETLKKQPGFQFADVGYKFTGNSRTDYIALRLHVDGKCDATSSDCLPKTFLDGTLPTDVIVSNFVPAGTTDAGAKIRSDGTPASKFGTLGMGVDGDAFGSGYFLTCAHVVTDTQNPPDKNYDVSDIQGDVVARATTESPRFFQFNDFLDAAILAPHVSVTESDLGPFRQYLPSDVDPPNRVSEVEQNDLDLAVYKIGATTDATWGFIDSVHPMPIPIQGTGLNASDHFIVRSERDQNRRHNARKSFAKGGDSGSIVCTANGRVLGMVRAVLDDNDDSVVDRVVVTRMTNLMAVMPFRLR